MSSPVLPAKGSVAGVTTDVDFDAQDFIDAIYTLPDAEFMAPYIEKAMIDSGEVVRENVAIKALRHRRSGTLQGKIRLKTAGTGWDMTVDIHSGGPVAHLIAGGVRRHEIRPSPHRIMKFPKGGISGFGYSVQHPGFPGDHYFRRGVEASVPEVNAVLKKSAADIIAAVAVRLRGKP
jgi:hypothetical protein